MLDITGTYISELNDSDLRTLVALLAEAEVRQAGFSAVAVRAGGDQNAPDGGLDVRVHLPPSTETKGFIPKPLTGFQIKAMRMAPGAIEAEMCPNGILRPVIRELATAGGAYIIVAGTESASDSALARRRKAMKDATEGVVAVPSTLVLDFYDSDRIASWVREHIGLAIWVRERIGRSMKGWRPFGSWTNAPPDSEYLVDDTARLHDGNAFREAGVAISEGIGRIRQSLSRGGNAVRLVGLSGLGKDSLGSSAVRRTSWTRLIGPGACVLH